MTLRCEVRSGVSNVHWEASRQGGVRRDDGRRESEHRGAGESLGCGGEGLGVVHSLQGKSGAHEKRSDQMATRQEREGEGGPERPRKRRWRKGMRVHWRSRAATRVSCPSLAIPVVFAPARPRRVSSLRYREPGTHRPRAARHAPLHHHFVAIRI
jgi:hypothetical protein